MGLDPAPGHGAAHGAKVQTEMLGHRRRVLHKPLGCSQALLAVVVIILPSLESHAMGCPARCECTALQKSVVCHRRRMVAIPEGIPTETKSLDLSKNRLRSLDPDDFSNFLLLEELEVNENVIANIEPGAFNNLPFLRSLSLRNNRLKLIPRGVFSRLTNLTHLDISENKIVILLDYMFQDLRNLKRLEVGDNELVYVSHHAFKGLQSLEQLTLEKCNLTSLPTEALSHLGSLSTLRLRHLNIASILPFSFRRLLRLKVLELSHWPMLEELPMNSLYALNLTALSITFTNITTVPQSALQPLVNLRLLNLSYNQIRVVEAGAFQNLIRLQELHVAVSRLTTIKPQAFIGLSKLRVLNVSKNLLQSLEESAFQSTSSLQVLGLDSNPLACDCRLLWVVRRRRRLALGERQPSCESPEHVKGMAFGDFPEEMSPYYFSCKKPWITVQKPQQVATAESQTVLLPCQAEGDPQPSIMWVSPWKQKITAQSNGRMAVLPDGTLQIRYAQILDSGTYVCVASNAAGNDTNTGILDVKSFSPQSLYNNDTLAYVGNGMNGTGSNATRARDQQLYDVKTILVAIAIGCFTFLGVVVLCLFILFLWSRGRGRHKPSVHVEYTSRRTESTDSGAQAPNPRQISMRMV
ncbi:uncharacterized protein LOC116942169 isoform X1 [Petromyzon marinus]|uniref:uncharacterized protein LOC116942169 isoform X1 n=2 Tax=Petromyzon marinus TaxID=7757 RepID=UPI003F707271